MSPTGIRAFWNPPRKYLYVLLFFIFLDQMKVLNEHFNLVLENKK